MTVSLKMGIHNDRVGTYIFKLKRGGAEETIVNEEQNGFKESILA